MEKNKVKTNIFDLKDEKNLLRLQKASSFAGKYFWKIFRAILMFGLCFVLLYPLIYMCSMTFRAMQDIYDPSIVWIPKNFTMKNIQEVWGIMDYVDSLWTSVKTNVLSSLLQILTCAMTGYAFARFKFKFKGVLFAILLFAIIVPPQLTSIPMYLQFKEYGILGTGFTFYIPAVFGVGLNAALFMFLFRQFFSGLPTELEDAAAIDGCGFIATFFRIMLPNAGSAFLTTIILSVVWYWNDYILGAMFFTHHKTIMTALVEVKAGIFSLDVTTSSDPFRHITRMQAGSLLAIAPVTIFYIFVQKYFVAGLERSGIVG